jgi:hypothetical protein
VSQDSRGDWRLLRVAPCKVPAFLTWFWAVSFLCFSFWGCCGYQRY